MDIQAVTTIISTVGFPIACCVYMAYMVKDMNEKHQQEMNSMRDALNANTNAIDKLEALISQLMTRLNAQ